MSYSVAALLIKSWRSRGVSRCDHWSSYRLCTIRGFTRHLTVAPLGVRRWHLIHPCTQKDEFCSVRLVIDWELRNKPIMSEGIASSRTRFVINSGCAWVCLLLESMTISCGLATKYSTKNNWLSSTITYTTREHTQQNTYKPNMYYSQYSRFHTCQGASSQLQMRVISPSSVPHYT